MKLGIVSLTHLSTHLPTTYFPTFPPIHLPFIYLVTILLVYLFTYFPSNPFDLLSIYPTTFRCCLWSHKGKDRYQVKVT